ncbi:cupin domain-containing protein [Salinimicrobium xinjiangense]|uniref:cupin domain-containing protein n=1 Tax=Salinimicrobium xinjiangense TaxID=438596 RepID=UPI00040EED28|nr:cupin domain-containing protein [Salinimicrobium xinjiangense]
MEVQTFYFADDRRIPNSKFPVLRYKECFSERGEAGAAWLEKKFAENDWKNSWRNGVFDYHHYHSNTHEVLGVYNGSALLQLGGEKGQKIRVSAGDVIVIPAGVAHKNLESEDFAVVGAYPQGRSHDMNTGKKDERPEADKNIAAVPIPINDPLEGATGDLKRLWSL